MGLWSTLFGAKPQAMPKTLSGEPQPKTKTLPFELVSFEAEDGKGWVVRRVADKERLRMGMKGERIPWDMVDEASEGQLRAFNVSGVSYRPEALQSATFAPGKLLSLISETNNQYDRNAVAVWDAEKKLQIGYVPREIAPEVKRNLGRIQAVSMWEHLKDGKRVGLRVLIITDGKTFPI